MNNINNLLAALGDEINSLAQKGVPDPKEIARKLPLRSLTGDHISGGKIQNFNSAGITDTATKTQITISNEGVHVTALTVDNLENLTINGVLKTKVLEVEELRADIKFEKDVPITFSGDNLEGKGLLWAGKGHTKQFVFASNPDRFFVSENIDFARGKSITVNNVKLIDDKELGPTVTKSNLREVGRLNGLIVDGSISIGQYVTFNSQTNRFGIGIEEPSGAFSVAEDGVEVIIGTKDSVKGYIGTYASNALDLITDNTSRINISAGGNITLGNVSSSPIQVSIIGSLGINVNNIDSRTNLHVNGAIKFNNKIHLSGRAAPQDGAFNEGDIMWNSEPYPGKFVGWVCTKSGSPGLWSGFGRIE